MQKDQFVFHDAWGKRWRKFKLLTFAGMAVLVASVVLFVSSLLVSPQLEHSRMLEDLKHRIFPSTRQASAATAAGGDRALAAARAKAARGHASDPSLHPRKAEKIKAAFLDIPDASAPPAPGIRLESFTHLCPSWLRYTDAGEGIVENAELPIYDTDGRARLMPVLSNLLGDERVSEAVEALSLADDDVKKDFATRLADKLKAAGAAGVVIDWQEVDQGADHELENLISFLADSLRERGLETWLAVGLDSTFSGWDFESLASHVDRFVAMLDGEHTETDEPGPIASQDWLEGWLYVLSRSSDPEKWIAALGTYGIDWTEGTAAGEQITFADAMSRAGNAGCTQVKTAAPSFNGTFSYFSSGESHEVWFLDAASFANQANAVRAAGLGGIAVSDPGSVDPGIWRVLDSEAAATADAMDAVIPGGSAITSVGRGEVVNLDPTSLDGRRSFSRTRDGLIACGYDTLPAYPTLFRMGGTGGNKVCLTFDDGPDPEWTPAILDILKERGVKATFFVVGSEVEKYPGIVQRIAAEGHVIGNHSFNHPNLAEMPGALVRMELNATQRLVASLVGKSMALFRPPYNADSRPVKVEDLRPVKAAQSLGYMTVLESADPRDWEKPSRDELLQRVKDARMSGNIILLHDGGGDRSATVEALPAILDYLKERGDEVVSIGDLVGIDEGELMQPVAGEAGTLPAVASGAGFGVMRIFQRAAHIFLVAASVLVLARTLIVAALAVAHGRRATPAWGACPSVSVIIPAFNEEKVIAKTVGKMLASEYGGPLEILVIDDGSSDRTAEVVAGFADSRLSLVRQANGGKARALQNGVAQSSGEILVFADADTQFDRHAIRRLVDALQDPRVGAVSGKAKVGNLRTLTARCQDLEYACSFNLDRMAYAVWNCITVVPGAISAFRRAAIGAAGGFSTDTLAEDTDLTLAIHRAGFRVEYAPEAVAYTEAPEGMRQLARQRFRWAFGTLQCIWKHRVMTFNPRFKALGWFSLPGIWFFQILLAALSPLIDILFLQALLRGHGADILPYFLVFLFCDLALAAVAARLERMPLRKAWLIIPQRFLYRPLLSYVIWRSLLQAMRGAWVGWNKLPRTASVSAA